MIQDIKPARFENHYEHLQPAAGDRILFFQDDKLCLRCEGTSVCIDLPKWEEFSPSAKAVYAFSISGERYFMVMESDVIPEGYACCSMRELRDLRHRDNLSMFIAYTAWHLWKWYQSSRFCGCCGAKTEFDTAERAVNCPVCGNKIYPRINPAVIVGVTNGDRILLTRYKTGFAFNALIAGFTEFGETMEETVRREVMEEAGLRVKNIRYYKSQPWGIASDILLGYYCDVDGDDTIHRDDTELKYAEWVDRDKIELQPDSLSLTNEMMMMFKNGAV